MTAGSGRTSCGISSDGHGESSRSASSTVFSIDSVRSDGSGAGWPDVGGGTAGSSETGVRILSGVSPLRLGVGNLVLIISSLAISSFVTFTPLLSFVKVG